MKINKMLAAATACAAFVFIPNVAGAVPVTGGAGAAYGEHVSTHARHPGGFSGQLPGMNPGDHRGFSGYAEPHH